MLSGSQLSEIRSNVGIIPWWIYLLPHTFGKISGIIFRNRFYLNKKLYKDLMSNSPSHLVIGMTLHELEHIKRSKEKGGYFLYQFHYSTSRKFRYQEELACHIPQFKYYKEAGYSYNLEKRAKILSGSLYFWCVPYKKALEDLKKIWMIS